LGTAGKAWWAWAWKLPHACAWSAGDLYVVARRARLEDDARTVTSEREMRELDDRLGLTPKGMAALRWRIVEPAAAEGVAPDPKVASLDDRRAALAERAS
jgi:hypothetical protein